VEALSCPLCAQPLTRHGFDLAGEVHACAASCGHWLDTAASQALVRGDLPVEAHAVLRPKKRAEHVPVDHAYRTAAVVEKDQATACPVCNGVLTDYVSDKSKLGVTVRLDVCAKHGTWFDRGEAWPLLQAFVLQKTERELEAEVQKRSDAVVGLAGSAKHPTTQKDILEFVRRL